MTRSQKVVFVWLGVVLLVFIALVVWGHTRPVCKGTQRQCADSYEPGSAMKVLSGLFSSSGPRIKLPQENYTVAAGATLALSIPTAKAATRTLKLRLESGVRAELRLVNNDGGGSDELADQREALPLANPPRGATDLRSLSFAVTKGGATLTLTCNPAAPCRIAVE